MISKRHKRVCTTLNYIESILILASAVIGCFSISAFASLVGILMGITSGISCDYLNKNSMKTNVATDEGNSRNEM